MCQYPLPVFLDRTLKLSGRGFASDDGRAEKRPPALCDEVRIGVAQLAVISHRVPLLIAAVDGDLGAVGQERHHVSAGAGGGAEVQGAALGCLHGALPGRQGRDEGQAEVSGKGPHQIRGDGLYVVLHPEGVGGVVVVAQLQQHGGHIGLAHLAQGGGGHGIDLVGQRVDLLEPLHEDVGGTAAVGAGGIVEGDDAPHCAFPAAVGAAVGVKRQIEIVAAGVGQADGAGGGHIGGVAGEADGVGQQVRLHGVGDEVHEILLGAVAGDIRVILLGGRT